MEYYEKYADVDKYCYFVEANEPSIAGLVHEIACYPHFHKNVEFLFVTKGVQHAIIAGEKVVAEAGDILYVDTFEPHSFADDKGVEGYILVVSLWYVDCFQKMFEQQHFPRVMRDKEQNASIFAFIQEWIRICFIVKCDSIIILREGCAVNISIFVMRATWTENINLI